MKRNMTCIVCPMGCDMEIEICDGKPIEVKGNTCKRGHEYAITECTHPQRTLTSTVRCQDGRYLPVKTSSPIPKEEMFNLMKKLSEITISLPINAGDVIIKDIYGAAVVACANMR